MGWNKGLCCHQGPQHKEVTRVWLHHVQTGWLYWWSPSEQTTQTEQQRSGDQASHAQRCKAFVCLFTVNYLVLIWSYLSCLCELCTFYCSGCLQDMTFRLVSNVFILTQCHWEGLPEPAAIPFLESRKAHLNPQNPVSGNLFLGSLSHNPLYLCKWTWFGIFLRLLFLVWLSIVSSIRAMVLKNGIFESGDFFLVEQRLNHGWNESRLMVQCYGTHQRGGKWFWRFWFEGCS